MLSHDLFVLCFSLASQQENCISATVFIYFGIIATNISRAIRNHMWPTTAHFIFNSNSGTASESITLVVLSQIRSAWCRIISL